MRGWLALGLLLVLSPSRASAQTAPEQLVAWGGYHRSVRLTWLPASSPAGGSPGDPAAAAPHDALEGSGLSADARLRLLAQATPEWGTVAAENTSGATAYRVYRATSTDGPFTMIADGLVVPWHRDDVVDNGRTYYYRVTAVVTGIESPFSDTASARAANGGHRIEAHFTTSPPLIDGRITAAEWANAAVVDITARGLPGTFSVTAYVMNSRTHLFIAVRDPNFPFPDDLNQIGIYFDENHDGAWNAPPSRPEGNVWVYYDATFYETSNLFRAITGVWPDHLSGALFGSVSAVRQALSYQSGDAEFEVAIDLTRVPLVSGPGRTIGLSIYSDQTGNPPYTGDWPPGVQSSALYFSAPVLYGDVALGPRPAMAFLDDETDDETLEELLASPNPAPGRVAFRSKAAAATPVALPLRPLLIFDVTGRLVSRIARSSPEVVWDGRDTAGAAVAPGLYLYRLDGGKGPHGRFVLVH